MAEPLAHYSSPPLLQLPALPTVENNSARSVPSLPDDVLNLLFSLMGADDLKQLRVICKKFKMLADNEKLWERHCRRCYRLSSPRTGSTWRQEFFNFERQRNLNEKRLVASLSNLRFNNDDLQTEFQSDRKVGLKITVPLTSPAAKLEDLPFDELTRYTNCVSSLTIESIHEDIENLTDERLLMLARAQPHIKYLELSGIPKVKAETMVRFLTTFHHLRSLKINYCDFTKFIVDSVFIHKKLEVIAFNGVGKNLGDDVLISLGSNLPKLSRLKELKLFFHKPAFSKYEVSKFIDSLSGLTVFDFESSIDDDILQIIGTRLPRVRKLCLGECSEVTSKGVSKLLQTCSALEVLVLKNCSQAVSEQSESFKEAHPSAYISFTPARVR